ncbi:MAG: serine/threonine-protein kinase [Myxococcota bacterium]
MVGTWDPFEDRPTTFGGRYRVGALLGTGGSGCVYQALDTHTGEQVALKVVEKPATRKPLRFLAEARDMARLRHPRVVRVKGLGREGGYYYSVLELMRGGSLKDRVESQGPMPVPEALGYVFMVLQGLHAVHAASLVHRDIKPHNVLLDDDGFPKLTDFGLARHEAGDVPWRTRTNESLGSPAYRAPEQSVNPAAAGREADIYGVGGVLYYLLSGRRPPAFYAMRDAEFLQQTFWLPEPVPPIIRKATRADPEDRYRTAFEMAAAVARAYDALPERAGESPVADQWIRDFEIVEASKRAPSWLGRVRSWLSGA